MPAPRPRSSAFLVVEAARCWRAVRDACVPAQPALFARLQPFGLGILAPVFDSLLALFEARFGRRFRTGDAGASTLSEDEAQLIELLAEETGAGDDAAAGFAPMHVALRSTRIMLALADADPGAHDRPIFFTAPDAPVMRPEVLPMRAPIAGA